MDKNFLIGIGVLLILGIILIGGCIDEKTGEIYTANNSQNEDVQSCEKIQDDEKDMGYYVSAIDSKNNSFCENLRVGQSKDRCYHIVVINLERLEGFCGCGNIQESQIRDIRAS